MKSPRRAKPTLIYDGDCSFCKLWVERWRSYTGDRVEYAPYQEVADRFPDIAIDEFKRSVRYVDSSGKVSLGARAVARLMHHVQSKRWMSWAYDRLPLVGSIAEAIYRFVAAHRSAAYRLTVFLWGKDLRRPSYAVTRWLFLRGLGLVYLIAFLSLSGQILGLVGSDGILPAQTFLEAVKQKFSDDGYRLFPTLAWLDTGDSFLHFLCFAGAALSIILMIGYHPRIVTVLLWLTYLSLYTVGQDFLSFQWDILLLETGLLAIPFASTGFRPSRANKKPISIPILWLFRLLLFKLMFQSGVVKLTSGDATWLDLTALTYHYWTQPIPNPIAWFVAQLPLWFQKGSIALVLLVEIPAPFLIFFPRRARIFGAWVQILFQLLIVITGNYTFFNILTIVLCISLLDDRVLGRIIPQRVAKNLQVAAKDGRAGSFRRVIMAIFVTLMVILNTRQLALLFVPITAIPPILTSVWRWTVPFHLVNSYGLFRVMTTERPEIIVQGSRNGVHWEDYEFRYKPGDVHRAPPFVAPHQPRLDWQMWFAALGNYQRNPWFVNFAGRLLRGSPATLDLLEKNPFPDKPPRYIRAQLYNYRFTTEEERRETGAWWVREFRGLYLPVITLRE